MAYTATSKEPRTAWARHLDTVRRERDLSATQMFEEAGPRLGLGSKSRSAFLKFLEDRSPTVAEAAALAALYGWPDEQPAVAAPEPDLAAALRDLVVELRAMREERTRLAERVGDLEAQVAELVLAVPSAAGSAVRGELAAPGQ
jgi:hypothetical protein